MEDVDPDDVPLQIIAKLPSDDVLRAKVVNMMASEDMATFTLRDLMQKLGGPSVAIVLVANILPCKAFATR